MNKKYLLPLILILCLALTLTGYSANLFSTYDQRIKLTIDNTKIDSDLTWFPITVFLGAHGDAIDVGSACTDRGTNGAGNYTFIDLANIANYTGKITSVDIWADTTMASAKVATFYNTSGSNYTARDVSSALGAVTAGSKQTFEVDIKVEAGDYIGIYFTDNADTIERTNSGGSGVMWLAGDQIQLVGIAVSAGILYFNPSIDVGEI